MYSIKMHENEDSKILAEINGNEEQDGLNNNDPFANAHICTGFSKRRWMEIRTQIKPIAPILFQKFPFLSTRYQYIIDRSVAAIEKLPHARSLLSSYIKCCRLSLEYLKKQKRQGLWKEFARSEELKDLSFTLKLLCDTMVSICTQVGVALVKKARITKRDLYNIWKDNLKLPAENALTSNTKENINP